MKHLITGIQQAGIGVSDCTSAISYYKELFGMNILIFDDTANADLMTSYTGDKVYRRRAVLTMNLSGGGGFELWQFLSRKPESCRPEYGDYGIFSITLKCQEIHSAYESFKTKKDIILSALKKNPAGEYHFCIEDIYQNSFSIVEGKEWFKTDGKSVGGVIGGVIGVADMEASVKFYADFLGIKDVVYDVTGYFEDIPRSSEHEFRQVLLRKAKSPCGAFTNLLGEVEIELVQRIQHRGKKIFENRYWGDCGFIHLCFDVTDMDTLKELSVSKGY
ncbi:MAG: VOC family protein, partial [Ginsengibacter sp.]